MGLNIYSADTVRRWTVVYNTYSVFYTVFYTVNENSVS